MLLAQWIEVSIASVGLTLAGWMTYDLCFDLRAMYRSGTNGIKESLCWGALATSAILLVLQLLYLLSGIAMIVADPVSFRLPELAPDSIAQVQKFMAVRGATASSLICLITIVQRVLRRRIYILDLKIVRR